MSSNDGSSSATELDSGAFAAFVPVSVIAEPLAAPPLEREPCRRRPIDLESVKRLMMTTLSSCGASHLASVWKLANSRAGTGASPMIRSSVSTARRTSGEILTECRGGQAEHMHGQMRSDARKAWAGMDTETERARGVAECSP